MKTIRDWHDIMTKMTAGTKYEVLTKEDITSPVVAIVPGGIGTPQRIAIYPKKTMNTPGLVIEADVFDLPGVEKLLGTPDRIKGNRPHYQNVSEETILEVCRIFLCKRDFQI